MKKPNLKLTVALIVFAVCVVGILTYVSVLGENHQINRVIVNFFNNLQDGEYLETCKSFSWFSSKVQPLEAEIARLKDECEAGRLNEEVYRQKREVLEARIRAILDEHCLNPNFLLELSLLQYYNLLDHDDYKVELKRNRFWIPFSSEDSVQVSILLKAKKDKTIANIFSRDHGQTKNFIEDLIVVVREKGTWKIKQFNIADSVIADTYSNWRRDIDVNKYVTMTSDGLRFQNAEINFKALTPIDKRLLRFSLYKIQRVLGVSPKKTEGFPMP